MSASPPIRSPPRRLRRSEPDRDTGCSLTGSFQAAYPERPVGGDGQIGHGGDIWLLFFRFRIRKRRRVVEEVDGRREELPTRGGGREVQDAVGVARRVADEHVAQHPFGDRGGARVADEVGAELALADL